MQICLFILFFEVDVYCSPDHILTGVFGGLPRGWSLLQSRPCSHWGVWRFTKLCWVGKRINIVIKPTISPTQGQPNPRKNRWKVAFWATFAHSKYFFVGWDWFHVGNRLQKTQSNQLLRKLPTFFFVIFVVSFYYVRIICTWYYFMFLLLWYTALDVSMWRPKQYLHSRPMWHEFHLVVLRLGPKYSPCQQHEAWAH